eukprot:CAMPEP_0171537070 /NCGR_PEP_ID=MMETSP0959-20130129/18257_1 /TAXON_ID=87120 /ORGANISM="Aurantiochytrium limacinum, Strain ATCCMYA-1381" /LENGTH=30 /DNA_ID= /DNA_START= /DNA_END= /DNA_ORIENTATION=
MPIWDIENKTENNYYYHELTEKPERLKTGM